MIIKQYSIKDVVAEEFGKLFPAKNDAVAIRQFDLILHDANDKSDFELWCVGEFDSETGQLLLPFDSYKVAIAEEVADVDDEN